MKNLSATLSSIALLLACHGNAAAYQSTYPKVQWEQRGNDTFYCIDITDEHWNIYPGLQAVACGENMYEFLPEQYVRDTFHIELPEGFTFYWRVWSPGGYGGNGFEGVVKVRQDCGLPYRSDTDALQWGCRFRDTQYCLDIFDANWKPITTPQVCGENLHSFNPKELSARNLPSGTYRWKVWSPSAYDYWSEQRYFEGEFSYQKPILTPETPSNLTGTYKYTTTNPNLSGDCELLKYFLGCTSAWNCQIMGVSGKMDITQNGDRLNIDISPNNNAIMIEYLGEGHITVTGNRSGNRFTASLFEKSSGNGCTATESFSQTGQISGNGFAGQFTGKSVLEGDCEGYTLNCTMTADYTATK